MVRRHRFTCLIIAFMTILALFACKRETAGIKPDAAESVRSSFIPKPRNVALVLDTSGSMQANDANRMMLYSAMLFTDLLEANDSLSVITFPGGEDVKTVEQLQLKMPRWAVSKENMISGRTKNEMKNFVKSIHYNSHFTIFKEPMQKAIASVSGGTDESFSQRVIVFFSDGATDRHNLPGMDSSSRSILAADHSAEIDALRNHVVPGLKHKGITFYGVVLGQDTAANHFDIMADATGGLVRKAARPEDLALNFTEVFSKILQTEVEKRSLYTNKYVTQPVNNYVKELIIAVPTRNLEEAKKISLHLAEPPSSAIGKAHELHTSSSQTSSQDLWNRTTFAADGLMAATRGGKIEAGGYAIWKVKKPRKGEWKIQLEGQSPPSVQAIVIQNYGIYMEVEGSRNRSGMVGEPNAFKARLITEEGEPITDPDFYSKNNFRYEFFVDGEKVTDLKPDKGFQLMYDYTPQTAGSAKVEIVAKNDLFLSVKVPIEFTAHKDVALHLKGPIDFGQRISWTDWFLEKLGSWFGPRIWTPGSRWDGNPAIADFKGSAKNAEGVRFKIDNTELYNRMKAKVLNVAGSETFYLDKNMQVRFCIDIDRDSDGGDLSSISVPITTMNGKAISGVTHLPLKGSIAPLSPWSWKYSHLWLEELIILWMFLFFVGKPLIYVAWNSFPRSKRYFDGSYDMFKEETKGRTADHAARTPMGHSLILRLPLGYFQFLHGTQISGGSGLMMLRTNPLSRLFWFILAIFLPVSMANTKKIDTFRFYRYRGETYVTEDQFYELCNKENRGKGTGLKKNEKPDPRKLVLKNSVSQYISQTASGMKRILHILP